MTGRRGAKSAVRRAPARIVRRRRRHRGDIMSPETRSRVMARIRGRDTGPERLVAAALTELGLAWEAHVRDLPGRPDFVFRAAGVAVFVDGDFWHGWRFPAWRDKLSAAWEDKIAANRRRDLRTHRSLRAAGWKVVRIWEHQLERDADACIAKILAALAGRGCRMKARSGAADITVPK